MSVCISAYLFAQGWITPGCYAVCLILLIWWLFGVISKLIGITFTAVAPQESIVIACPGKNVELLHTVTSGSSTPASWYINHTGLYTVNDLRDGILTGYRANNSNLIIQNIMRNDGRNCSEYQCLVGQNNGTTTILYLPGEYHYSCHMYMHWNV